MMNHTHRWALVLAAGEGSRVASMTVDRSGVAVPKQFCGPGGGESLLARAVRRATRQLPVERVATVVATHHRRWWRRETLQLEERNVYVQPANRGTAPGILFPLVDLAERDPQARVLVLPADHFVGDESVLAAAARQALDDVDEHPERIVLLGVTPDSPETSYGWMLAENHHPGPRRVCAFVEKPAAEAAEALYRDGGLWNTFLFAARADRLLELSEQTLPGLVGSLRGAWARFRAGDPVALMRAYDGLPTADFSSRVLQAARGELWVRPVAACGWDDLGTPERVRRRVGRLVPPTVVRRPAGVLPWLRPAAGAEPVSLAA